MPTPRHVSLAAIDPVETVTPPFGGRAGATGSYCICLFYSESRSCQIHVGFDANEMRFLVEMQLEGDTFRNEEVALLQYLAPA